METLQLDVLLKKVSLFSNLNDHYVKQLASSCRKEAYEKGATIFYQTDPSNNLYIILSGKVNAILIDEEGNEMVLSTFKKGDFFGELSLFDGKGRSATLVAVEKAELAVLKRDEFMSLLIAKPEMATALIVELAERLRKSNDLIESLVFLDVRERLMKVLLKIGKSEGERKGDCIKFTKKTHHELATLVGASREAITKCMKFFTVKGMLKEEEGYFLLVKNGINKCLEM